MRKGYLIFETGEAKGHRIAVGECLVMGRVEDCDLVIEDSAASRRHAEIRLKKNAFHIKDLESTNGTLVNGMRILEGVLNTGSQIQIGESIFRFEIEEVPDVPSTPSFLGTILDGDSELKLTMSGEKSEALFQAIYTVTNAVATNYEPCNLVDRILETTIKAIRAQRGAVLFAGKLEGELAPCPVCNRVHEIRDGALEKSTLGDIRISGTVARRVLNGGESVLFSEAGGDAELNAAVSIVNLNLRSIICVPLRAKSGILGILYIDTDQASRPYTQEDMLLSTAVGNSAGLAIENANMHLAMLEKQRIEQEIAHAWTIQQGFLVKDWPEADAGFEVYGETRPAKTVGGDFYDYVRPDERHVGILIGDVSGKGVPAALAMAQLLAQFRLYAREKSSPADVLKALNDDLVTRSQRGMFCTLCYLLIDLAKGRVLCANAGHHPAIHIHAKGATCFAEASGPPAGILPTATWADSELRIVKGDTLLMYTDGVVEARHGVTQHGSTLPLGPEEYGIEGLYRITQQASGLTPRALIAAVNDDVSEYCTPESPHDDVTMIAVRYLGRAK